MIKVTAKRLALAAVVFVLFRRLRRRFRAGFVLSRPCAGKKAAVTGAASGVGKCVAKLLLSKGWIVFAGDINNTGLEQLEKECGQNERLKTMHLDLASVQSCQRFQEQVLSECDNALEAVINVAGITFPLPALSADMRSTDLQLKVNLEGPIRMSKLFWRALCNGREGGAIVNVSSISGSVAWSFQGIYASTKFGLNGFTDAVRREIKHAGLTDKLRIVSIDPGPISTPLTTNLTSQADKWIEEHPDDPFTSALKMVNDTHKGMPTSGVFMTPEEVAKAVVVAAMETNPESRYIVQRPAMDFIFTLLYYAPDIVSDAIMKNL